MKRKVVRHGTSTLTVSLPSKWARKLGIKHGDEIDVEEEGRKLEVSTEKDKDRAKKAFLDLKDLNRMLLDRFLSEFYREGVEEIVINFESPLIYDDKNEKEIDARKYLKRMIERFIGMEVISASEKRVVLQSFLKGEESREASRVLKRVYYLLKEFTDEFMGAMDRDFAEFHKASYDYHDNVVKFISYYLRLLYLSDMEEPKKMRLTGMMTVVDKSVDIIRHCSERIAEIKKPSPAIKKRMGEVFETFLQMFDIVIKEKASLEDLRRLTRRRYILIKAIRSGNLHEKERHALLEAKPLLDAITEFFEDYIALNMNNYVREF